MAPSPSQVVSSPAAVCLVVHGMDSDAVVERDLIAFLLFFVRSIVLNAKGSDVF